MTHIVCIEYRYLFDCNIIRGANEKRCVVSKFGDGLPGQRVSGYAQAYVLPSCLQHTSVVSAGRSRSHER